MTIFVKNLMSRAKHYQGIKYLEEEKKKTKY
jgi:hypothetical protein